MCLYIRPSVRPQSFSDFDLIWCVGGPRPDMCTSVTSTRFTVKVTELPKLRKLHFSRSISATVLALNSKLMVGGDMGPGLQLVGARFSSFFSRKAIMRVQTSGNVDISRYSNGHISVVCDATVTWLGLSVVLHVLCMLM